MSVSDEFIIFSVVDEKFGISEEKKYKFSIFSRKIEKYFEKPDMTYAVGYSLRDEHQKLYTLDIFDRFAISSDKKIILDRKENKLISTRFESFSQCTMFQYLPEQNVIYFIGSNVFYEFVVHKIDETPLFRDFPLFSNFIKNFEFFTEFSVFKKIFDNFDKIFSEEFLLEISKLRAMNSVRALNKMVDVYFSDAYCVRSPLFFVYWILKKDFDKLTHEAFQDISYSLLSALKGYEDSTHLCFDKMNPIRNNLAKRLITATKRTRLSPELSMYRDSLNTRLPENYEEYAEEYFNSDALGAFWCK